MLNDANTELLRVYEAAIFRGVQGESIGQFDEIMVPKSAIDCALLTEARHEAPMRRQYALVEKRSHPVFVLLADCAVRGSVMFGGHVDPALLLNSSASNFFPVVNADVSSVDVEGPTLSTKVAFINKYNVSLLRIEKRSLVTTTAGALPGVS